MRRQRRRLLAEINVVPYVDVCLVLLVIFMITAPMMTQGVKVNLPHAKAEQLQPSKNKPLIISVDTQGAYYINSDEGKKPLSASQLAVWVKASLKYSNTGDIFIRGDQDVDYGRVVQAMVIAQKAGAQSIGLMTKEQSQRKRA